VHAACFGNDLEMLRFLVDSKKENINPYSNQISENTPLRFACKASYYNLIEFLVKRGAYYYDDSKNYCNNCAKIEENGEIRFKTLDGKEILPNFVLRFDRDHLEPEIRAFIRFIQWKNFSVLKKLSLGDFEGFSQKLLIEMKRFRDAEWVKTVKKFIGN